MTDQTYLWILGAVTVICAALLIRSAWIAGRPARGRKLYFAGRAYVQDQLNEHGDSRETRENLWAEHDCGMDFDPGPFELGMRETLDSLAPLKEPSP